MTRNTSGLLFPLALAGAALLSACSTTASTPASTIPQAPTATQTATQTVTQTPSSSATQATASAPTQSASTQPQGGHGSSTETSFPSGSPTGDSAPAPALCAAADLEVTHRADPDGTGAGHVGIALTVKNISGRACQFGNPDGKPMIAFVTGPSTVEPIGAAATYATPPQDRVLIMPGTAVVAQLQIARAANIADCEPRPAWALAVFPVAKQPAVTPVDDLTACANASQTLISALPWKAA